MIGFDDIDYAGCSDVGVKRSHNQDAHALVPAKDREQWRGRGHVFVVADGMGAHAVGELASKLAADSIPHLYSKHAREGAESALRKAFVETNLAIHTRGQQNREFEGMGTTATALLMRPEGAWVGHVGDSRAYRVRDGTIEQLSFDHSLVWELARRQRRDPDELRGIPTNVIVRSLGPEPLVEVDVEGPHEIKPGDAFVLCSDGLSGPVSDREIGAVVCALPPDEAGKFLIHLANLQGGPDNITAVIVRVPPLDPAKSSSRAKPSALGHWFGEVPWPFWALAVGILLAGGAILCTVQHIRGGLPTGLFVLAALSLGGGLVGLMTHGLREKHPHDGAPAKPNIYRHVSCSIDRHYVDRLGQAVADLQAQVEGNEWEADWDAIRGHLELSDRPLDGNDMVGAFREKCRAMLLLMDAVHRQRGKAEQFKPLWDRVVD